MVNVLQKLQMEYNLFKIVNHYNGHLYLTLYIKYTSIKIFN